LISLSTTGEEAGKFFGFHRAMDTTGAIIGPVLAFFLLPILANNLRHLFLLAMVFGLLIVILIIFFVHDQRKSQGLQPLRFSLRLFDQRFKLFLLALFIFSLATFSPVFLFLKAQEIGLSLPYIPLIYAAANGVYALGSTPAGILADKIGHRKTLMIGMVTFILTFLGFGYFEDLTVIWILFTLWGLYNALTDGVARAIVADLSPENLRGTAYGLQSMIVCLALFCSSVMAGFLWQSFNSSTAFYTSAGLALISLITLMSSLKNK